MKKKIFIANEDGSILETLKLILEKAGYTTETTLNGKTLLNNLPIGSDLILLDVRISLGDGLFICKHLKSMDATRGIPIIIFSAFPDMKSLAKKAGADDFLEKPFNKSDLLGIVEKYTQSPAA